MSGLTASALAAALLLTATVATAQGSIATDRPGFTFNPTVVPAGAFQVEVGTPQVTRAGFDLPTPQGGTPSSATSTLLNVPTQLRYGVTPRLEARVFSTLYNSVSYVVEGTAPEIDGASGFGDVEVGLKYQILTATPGGTPNLSFIPTVVVPVGETGFSVEDPVVNANVAAGFALPSALSLTVLAGATVPTADGSNVNANLAVLAGRSFTPQLSGYVEAAAFPTDGATPLYAGAGLAYLVSPLVQLDAFFDAGLNDDATDLFAGIGISARFGR
ncbi:MAG TPA: transporter [Rubricoccaceae bacterium]